MVVGHGIAQSAQTGNRQVILFVGVAAQLVHYRLRNREGRLSQAQLVDFPALGKHRIAAFINGDSGGGAHAADIQVEVNLRRVRGVGHGGVPLQVVSRVIELASARH